MDVHGNGARSWHPGAVVAGGILLALGLAMLLTPAEDLRLETGRLIGPFAMIIIGTTILLGGRGGANHAPGDLWLIGIGCWLLVSQTHLFGLAFRTSWPLLLIVMGLLLMIRGWR